MTGKMHILFIRVTFLLWITMLNSNTKQRYEMIKNTYLFTGKVIPHFEYKSIEWYRQLILECYRRWMEVQHLHNFTYCWKRKMLFFYQANYMRGQTTENNKTSVLAVWDVRRSIMGNVEIVYIFQKWLGISRTIFQLYHPGTFILNGMPNPRRLFFKPFVETWSLGGGGVTKENSWDFFTIE